METFLNCSKKYLANLSAYPRIRVILGNPTCDLDSAVCALALGLLEFTESGSEGPAVLSVLNVTRDEFRLKTEVVHHLRRCGVPGDLLTFRNEIDLHCLHRRGNLELVLVDHHTLPTEDACLAGSVVEIVDHRPHDSSWPWTDLSKLTLETVGSCATLVGRSLLERKPDLAPVLGELLRGAILIDTANLSKAAARAVQLDHEIMSKLENLCGIEDPASTRSSLFQELLTAKTDVSELSPADLLVKDLKVVNGIPLPGFPILVKDFLELDGAQSALEAFCQARDCRLLVLLGMQLKGDAVTRDLAVFSLGPDRQLANKLIEALVSSDLQLTEAKRADEPGKLLLLLLEQANVRATRKQILPIIQSASS